ncbi:MAG TPA: anaerobic ribonucleoside-triphosphate reductase activating protein [Syntrophales bacterium]|nr:anaerobic ribonucleoside-triphosphate reductase activating protein [Syntrophales bacterium]
MKIGGLQKVSLIDYPGCISAIVFTIGCNFRCPYCHNPELVKASLHPSPLPAADVFEFLKRRQGKLEAVVITGGEPCLQPDLPEFAVALKTMGYLVKVDTNGSRPEVLERLLAEKAVDYVAMDIKAPLSRYESVAGVPVVQKDIRRSVERILACGIGYEFRTTVAPSLLGPEDFAEIGKRIRHARRYVLQGFVPSKTLSAAYLRKKSPSSEDLEAIRDVVKRYVETVVIR